MLSEIAGYCLCILGGVAIAIALDVVWKAIYRLVDIYKQKIKVAPQDLPIPFSQPSSNQILPTSVFPFPERCGCPICTNSADYFAYSNSPEALRGMNTSRLHPNPPQALIDMHEAIQRAKATGERYLYLVDLDEGRKDN